MSGAPNVRLDTVEEAIADIAAGKAVVVVDDEDRENEGDPSSPQASPRPS
jgi:3,4-dihydroxy 2-butanone 4-phosphate synthase/GTP cyclohydrolase II